MARRADRRRWVRSALLVALVLSLVLLVSAPQGSGHGAACLFFTILPLLFLGLLPLPGDVPLPAVGKILPKAPEVPPRSLQLPPPAAR